MNVIKYLLLPRQISPSEQKHLATLDRRVWLFFALHFPLNMGVAALAGTGVLKAGLMTGFVLLGLPLAQMVLANPRHRSLVYAVIAMSLGGLLVHFEQGPNQVEMHFYFFVVIALLSVFANPMVIVVAALTVILHHLILFMLLPSSLLNHEATVWTVAIHAVFVVAESMGAIFVARNFFDRVIGLERIVERRTQQLRIRTNELGLMLDNIEQGLLTFDLAGVMSPVKSAILKKWIGAGTEHPTIWKYLGQCDEAVAQQFEAAWQSVVDDVLPLELSLDQMPRRMKAGDQILELTYRPIMQDDRLSHMLCVISNITSKLERARYEADNNALLSVLEHVLKDPAGLTAFMAEAEHLMHVIVDEKASLENRRRAVHTLKGNCGLYGLGEIAARCHELESHQESAPDELRPFVEQLYASWSSLSTRLRRLFGHAAGSTITVREPDYHALVAAVRNDAPREDVLRALEVLQLESTELPLERLAAQARALGTRLGKGEVSVQVQSNDVRVSPSVLAHFWGSLIHVVRNAIDHGLETPEERVRAGKSASGHIRLKTSLEDGDFVCEVADDGRGINWEAVRASAKKAGIPLETEDDLVESLFASGLSTRDEVTEISGRGIGMGAVRASCLELGGRIRVESQRGLSTRVEFRIPEARLKMQMSTFH